MQMWIQKMSRISAVAALQIALLQTQRVWWESVVLRMKNH